MSVCFFWVLWTSYAILPLGVNVCVCVRDVPSKCVFLGFFIIDVQIIHIWREAKSICS